MAPGEARENESCRNSEEEARRVRFACCVMSCVRHRRMDAASLHE